MKLSIATLPPLHLCRYHRTGMLPGSTTSWGPSRQFRESHKFASDAELAALIGSHTVFYTPKVVNSPRQIEQDIQPWRNRLRAIPLEAIRREAEGPLERARLQDEASQHEFFLK